MSDIKIYSPSDFRAERNREREFGVERGKLLGFRTFRDAYSVKLGSTTYLYGAPYSGKTTLKYEILRQLSEYYGWNHLIIDPETGRGADVSSQIIKVTAGKDIGPNYNNQMSAAEMVQAEQIGDKHYYIIDLIESGKVDIDKIFNAHTKLEQETGKKIHTISIDPWNYVSHDYMAYGGWSGYLEYILPYIYRKAIEKNIHVFIIHHVRDQKERTVKIDNQVYYYYPAPNPRDLGGGQGWYRYGMAMICCWIPPKWWKDEDGYPIRAYETQVYFQKKKPEGVSEVGDQTDFAKLYWQPKHRRYIESYGGTDRYPTNPQTKAEPLTFESHDEEEDLPF